MTHDDDTCPHLVRANLLEARNKKLQTEVDHLMIFCNCTLVPNKELQAENARLKADVERLKTEVNHLMVFCNCTLIPNKELQAHIERLTKAGDAVCESPYLWETDPAVIDWRAAKEGKSQP